MAGLLDFMQTPQGIGMLSAVAGGLAGARRGTPLNNVGRGLVSGLTGYSAAQDQIRQDQENALTKQYRELQMQQLQRQMEQQKSQQAWKAGLPGVMKPSISAQGAQLNEQDAAFGDEGTQATIEAGQYAPNAQLRITPQVDQQAVQDYLMQPDSPFVDELIKQQITPKAPIKLGAGDTLIDPRTFKPLANVPGKSTWQDGGDRLYEMDSSGQPTGNTLPKAMAPNMQFVPGGDYKPSGVFNPRTGTFTPTDAPNQEPVVEPDPMAPWSGMPPKKADDMRSRLYATESKKLDDLRDQVARGRDVVRELDRFGELNRNQATGGLQDRVWILPSFDPDKREMEAIAAKLAPWQRAPGSGASSDRDIGLFLQGLPGIDKGGDVNKNIRTQFEKALTEAEKSLDFAERYFAEKGHLNGWQAAYKASNGGSKKLPARTSEGGSGTLNRGEILNVELQDAIARGDAQNANLIRQEMRRMGVKEAGAQKQQATPKQAKTFDFPPNAKQYEGKTLRDMKSGKRFKSINGKWVQVK